MIRPLSRTALILDIVGAALLFVLLTPLSVVFYAPQPADTTGVSAFGVSAIVVAGVFMFGGVAIGRLAPGIGLAAAWAGAIVQMLGGFGPLPIDFAILLVLYATSAWGTRRVLWWGFGSVIAGGIIAAAFMVFVGGVSFGTGTGWELVTGGTLLLAASIMALGFAWV
ncbi:sensor histidine kinase, partial [Salmonella enterica subsp. enterica serovar Haifa]|nr:sensor histidine kinase [Salmonella enterica subsp. enterica serovar Haifa]